MEPFEAVILEWPNPHNVPRASQDVVAVAAGSGGAAVSPTLGLSVGSNLGAIAVGAVAAAHI